MLTCNKCPDFQENMIKFHQPLMNEAVRHGPGYRGYDGKLFVYCPWCASKLVENISLILPNNPFSNPGGSH